MKIKKFATLSVAALAAFSLAACSSGDGKTAEESSSTPVAVAPPSNDESDDATEAPETSAPAAPAVGTAEDAARARTVALDFIEKEKGAQGIVIAQDLEDDKAKWDVDVLLGDEVFEVKVTADGKATLDSTEKADEEDIEAASSEFTIEQAIDKALAHTPGIIDNVDWSDDDKAWEVDIDVDGKDDDVELRVDTTGKVTERD